MAEDKSVEELQQRVDELEEKDRERQRQHQRHVNPWTSLFAELLAFGGGPQPDNTPDQDCFFPKKEKE